MTPILLINPLYALSGLAVGMLVGLTGVGGGSLMTPLLVLVFGIHPATAVGTDLLYAGATKTVGTGGAWRPAHGRLGHRRRASPPAACRPTAVTLVAMAHFHAKTHRYQHGVITSVLGVGPDPHRPSPSCFGR